MEVTSKVHILIKKKRSTVCSVSFLVLARQIFWIKEENLRLLTTLHLMGTGNGMSEPPILPYPWATSYCQAAKSQPWRTYSVLQLQLATSQSTKKGSLDLPETTSFVSFLQQSTAMHFFPALLLKASWNFLLFQDAPARLQRGRFGMQSLPLLHQLL